MDQSNAAIDLLFGYTGRMFDEVTALQNNWHRWYDPRIGSWISEDPIGFKGDPSNLYRYVRNNPLSHTDPTGLLAPTPVVLHPAGTAIFIGGQVGNLAYEYITKPLLEPCFTKIATRVWCRDYRSPKGQCKCGVKKVDHKGQEYISWDPAGKGSITYSECLSYCREWFGDDLVKIWWNGKYYDVSQ